MTVTGQQVLRPYDRVTIWSHWALVIVGLLQILFGMLSMALGVAAICAKATGYFIGYGIWCGFMVTLGGLFTACVSRCKATNTVNVCMMTTTVVMAILAACCGAFQLSIAIVAAANDNGARYTAQNYAGYDLFKSDIFYSKNNPSAVSCSGNMALNWVASWGPIDVLLILSGFIEMFLSVIAASLCCPSLCCQQRTSEFEILTEDSQSSPQAQSIISVSHPGTGFYNEGYVSHTPYVMTSSRSASRAGSRAPSRAPSKMPSSRLPSYNE